MGTSLSLLIKAASDGNLQEVRHLLKRGEDINATDDYGNTALIWASCKGHTDMVVQLLKHKMVDVNHQSDDGHTALMWASDNGHFEIVVELLNNDKLDVNLQDNDGLTALSWASLKGNFDIVVELLKHDEVDMNRQDYKGLTACIWASNHGHTDIVRCLNEQVPKEILNQQLIIAAKGGRLQEISNLLQEGANINATDDNGDQTALVWASFKGHSDVVAKLLTYSKVNVNHQTSKLETALILASVQGHLDVVAQLLKHHKVDVNLQNYDNTTALIAASYLGHSYIVSELLKHDNLDVNLQHENGHTALSWASLQGHYDIVVELLKRNVDVNHKDNHGSTALINASNRGHTNIVKQLLMHDTLDVNLEDNDGDTALLEASSRGHYDIVFELLELNKINCNHKNKLGKTALTLATDQGYEEIVWCLEYAQNVSRGKEQEEQQLDASLISAAEDGKLENVCDLLQRGANINAKDIVGNTALLFASHKGHHNIVVQLLKHDKVNVNLRNNFDCTALIVASCQGNFDIVVQLLKHDDVDVNCRDNNGQTALSLASFHGHSNIVVKLLNHRKVEVNLQDNHGTTALMMASLKGHYQIVVELLKVDKIDLNRQDKDSDTALLEASSNGYLEIVRELLKHGNLDMNHQNKSGQTALVLAAVNGHTDIVCCLTEYAQTCSRREENEKQRFDAKEQTPMQQEARALLHSVMERPTSDPVGFSMEHIQHFTTNAKLGTGAFGEIYAGHDSELPDEFVVKTINSNEATKFPYHANSERGVTLCVVCSQNIASMIRCNEGHLICTKCIQNMIVYGLSGGSHVFCQVEGCSSQPFRDKDLYGLLPAEVFMGYYQEKTLHTGFYNLSSEIKEVRAQNSNIEKGVNRISELLEEQVKKIGKLARGLDRNMALLSLLAAEHFNNCPHLVWITPVKVSSRNPKEWVKVVTKQKYKVVFICAHSYQPGHEPFEIEMPRGWIVKIAPWLKLCIHILIQSAKCLALPFPIPDLEYTVQCRMMNSCLDSVKQGMIFCDSILEEDLIQMDSYYQVKRLAGDAFKLISETASTEKRSEIWKSKMIPVHDTVRGLIWVKHEHQNKYKISTDSD